MGFGFFSAFTVHNAWHVFIHEIERITKVVNRNFEFAVTSLQREFDLSRFFEAQFQRAK